MSVRAKKRRLARRRQQREQAPQIAQRRARMAAHTHTLVMHPDTAAALVAKCERVSGLPSLFAAGSGFAASYAGITICENASLDPALVVHLDRTGAPIGVTRLGRRGETP